MSELGDVQAPPVYRLIFSATMSLESGAEASVVSIEVRHFPLFAQFLNFHGFHLFTHLVGSSVNRMGIWVRLSFSECGGCSRWQMVKSEICVLLEACLH